MIFNKRKNKNVALLNSFGKLKEESFHFEWIEKYFRKKDNSDAFHVINDKTCNDLDFKELFMYIDRTTSKVGQQFLYNKLRVIPANQSVQDEKLIALFSEDSEFRISVQTQLKRLKKEDAYFITTLFQDDHINPPKWFFVTKILAFTSVLALILLPFTFQMLFVIFGVFLINLGIHYWNKRNLYQYMASIPQLLRLTSIAREFFKNKNLMPINPNLSKSIETIGKIKSRMFFFKLEAKTDNEMGVFLGGIFELFKITFLIEPLLLFSILNRLDSKRKEIEALFSFVGEIDSLMSIASLRNGLINFCVPEITDTKNQLMMQEIYHPFIADCVTNNLLISEKSVLLTGSNMSGKTSFIRTVGINVITGLTINTCFAKQFSMPRMCVYSAIRISDDLLNNKSYYFEEVLTIKEMLDANKNSAPNLFLLDEIFKGTNTIERISAGKAVLSSLSKNGNIVFVSTHDIELADLLKDEYELYHFSEQVENKTVDFDFKLKDGKLKTRNAIRILQINNYPKDIVNEAIEIAKYFDSKSNN